VLSFAVKVNVKFPTSPVPGVPLNVPNEPSKDIHDGISLDTKYDMDGVLYENVDGERVNENCWPTTARGGI